MASPASPPLPSLLGAGGEERNGNTSALASLPCLYSNNSIEPPPESETLETIKALACLLTAPQKRTAHTLFSNVEKLCKEAESIGHVGFLTLTFPDNVKSAYEAQRRWNSLNTNFLRKWQDLKAWIHVKERQKRGAWHYHLVVSLKGDIRTGVDFKEISEGKYGSAGQYLRGLWTTLREKLDHYGFGRSELLPVKSNAEAMGRYVGKYISKHMGQREEEDKGVRLVSYSRGWIRNTCNFAWNTANSHEWRRKLKKFADYLGCSEFYQISERLGAGWAYRFADEIRNIDEILHDNGGEVAQEFQERLILMVARNLNNRKQRDLEETTLLMEGKEQEVQEMQREKRKQEDRKRKIMRHKTRVGIIKSQKWFTTDENMEEVKQEVQEYMDFQMHLDIEQAHKESEIRRQQAQEAMEEEGIGRKQQKSEVPF